jgi:hypothetical protein
MKVWYGIAKPISKSISCSLPLFYFNSFIKQLSQFNPAIYPDGMASHTSLQGILHIPRSAIRIRDQHISCHSGLPSPPQAIVPYVGKDPSTHESSSHELMTSKGPRPRNLRSLTPCARPFLQHFRSPGAPATGPAYLIPRCAPLSSHCCFMYNISSVIAVASITTLSNFPILQLLYLLHLHCCVLVIHTFPMNG